MRPGLGEEPSVVDQLELGLCFLWAPYFRPIRPLLNARARPASSLCSIVWRLLETLGPFERTQWAVHDRAAVVEPFSRTRHLHRSLKDTEPVVHGEGKHV